MTSEGGEGVGLTADKTVSAHSASRCQPGRSSGQPLTSLLPGCRVRNNKGGGAIVVEFAEDFRVVWKDPADAGRHWAFDALHFPRPVATFVQDILSPYLNESMYCTATAVNGYVFVREWTPPPPPPEVQARGPRVVFEQEYVPSIRAVCQRIRSRDYDAMSAGELADCLEDILREWVKAFQLTMLVISGVLGPTLELLAFCEREIGKEGPRLVASLLQGYQNETAAAGAGLAELAELAARRPEVAERLRTGRYDEIDSPAGGDEFTSAVRAFLAEYGWRSEGFLHPEFATWAEEPGKALALVARYVANPELSPRRAIERAAQGRGEALAAVRSRLGAEKLSEFERLFGAAAAHVPVTEARSRWQGVLMGSLRVPLIALGRKLVAVGALIDANDVFFVRLADLKAAAREPSRSLAKAVARNKADLERWRKLTPPAYLGAALDVAQAPPELAAVNEHFFGYREPVLTGNILSGKAASQGVGRGRARIIRDLSEAGRLERGDILVCQTTSPPWTPLFTLAAGVVTDSGGILSHSAICAREYAIPCVVATWVATTRIPDGALITVDGTHGTVTIEG